MISSSVRDHDAGFEELVSELVDAHVDTIELLVCRDDATTDAVHLEARRAGGRISGELAVSWSWVDVSVPKVYTCLGNARFSARRR